MGSGRDRRQVPGGAPIIRTAAALALCAIALGGCKTIEEGIRNVEAKIQKSEFWPFGAEDSPAAVKDVPVPRPKPADPRGAGELALDPKLITNVQSRLAELGYKPGPIDGVIGRRTRNALRLYQDENGLPASGRITEATLGQLALRSEPEDAEPESAKSEGAEPQSAGEGETTAEVAAAPDTASGPVPSYKAGTRFVFADGEVRTVIAADEDRVEWRSSGGSRFVTSSNFLIPRLSWRESTNSGVRIPGVSPDVLWPVHPGAEINFTTTALVRYGMRPDNLSQLRESWRCRIEETAPVTVRAGTFETQKIVCDGRAEPAGSESRYVWHYAPEIGHYVLHEEFDDIGRLRGRDELLAIQPDTTNWPPVARAGLGWALEHTLETAAAGEETEWKSSAVETEVTIKPGESAAKGRRQSCRSFLQIWSGPDGESIYPGFACRGPSGHWTIPGLDQGVEVAGKPS